MPIPGQRKPPLEWPRLQPAAAAPVAAGWGALGNQALSAMSGTNPLTCCRKLAARLSADYGITMPLGMHFLLHITFYVFKPL